MRLTRWGKAAPREARSSVFLQEAFFPGKIVSLLTTIFLPNSGMPEIIGWKWGVLGGAASKQRTSTEGDNT